MLLTHTSIVLKIYKKNELIFNINFIIILLILLILNF